jgi:hypothetical protein
MEDQLIESFYLIFQDLDFWMIELFIICYLNSFVFRKQVYNHQKVAILFSIVPILLKIGAITLSFYDNPNEEYNEKLPIYYIKNNPALKITFGILFYLTLIIQRSIVNLSLKWYMDIKYISPCQILKTFGIFGTILYFIFCFLTTFIKCYDSSLTNIRNAYNYICKVKEDDSYYIDSFYNYFDNYKKGLNEIIREIVVLISGIFGFFFNKLFTVLVIKYLSPVHVIFSVPIYFMCEKIAMISNTLILRYFTENKEDDDYYAFFATSNKFKIIKFVLDLSGDIFSLIGFLIYLEIIKLKCIDLHYNIRNNIIRRGIIDARNLDDISDESDSYNSQNDNSLPENGNSLPKNDDSLPENDNRLLANSRITEKNI